LMKRINGLIVLVIGALLSSGCVNGQSARVKPTYTAEFINCVADEMEARIYGQCTDNAITDWMVMVE
jgi:hypothetical protein